MSDHTASVVVAVAQVTQCVVLLAGCLSMRRQLWRLKHPGKR